MATPGGIYIIIIILMTWVWYIYFNHPKYDVFEYSQLKHKYKTGDMILFHGLDNCNPIFIGTYYGHVGIIYIDPEDETNTPYIFEAFCPSTMPIFPQECKKGISISLLENRMKSYRGYCFYKELERPIQDVNLLFEFREFIAFSIENMYYDEQIVLNSISKILFNESLGYGTNCGELVYLSLIKLNLLPQEYFDYNNKHHLLYLTRLNKMHNNRYNTPVYVLANYFEL